jgi:hypothetical protein
MIAPCPSGVTGSPFRPDALGTFSFGVAGTWVARGVVRKLRVLVSQAGQPIVAGRQLCPRYKVVAVPLLETFALGEQVPSPPNMKLVPTPIQISLFEAGNKFPQHRPDLGLGKTVIVGAWIGLIQKPAGHERLDRSTSRDPRHGTEATPLLPQAQGVVAPGILRKRLCPDQERLLWVWYTGAIEQTRFAERHRSIASVRCSPGSWTKSTGALSGLPSYAT